MSTAACLPYSPTCDPHDDHGPAERRACPGEPGWSVVHRLSPPQTITCTIPLVSIVIGERLATTLSGGSRHPARLRRQPAPPSRTARSGSPQVSRTLYESPARSSNRVHQPGAILRLETGDCSYRLSGRYRLSLTDDNLGAFARLDRDRGAAGHNAQRRLHAIQTLSQLSYSPTVCAQSELLTGRTGV
jgi:hypothetical protein